MATRSTIAMKTPEGKVQAIYCHWDGYPAHNGEMLRRHYKSADKVAQLIELGNLSSLGPEIGGKQDFDDRKSQNEDWCLAYGRDRGELDQDAVVYDTVGDWVENFDMGVEYYYLFDGQNWLVNAYGNKDAQGMFPQFDFVETVLDPKQLKELGWEPKNFS